MKIQVRIEDKQYEVEVENIHTQPIRANVDGEVFEVWMEASSEQIALPLPSPVGREILSPPTTDAGETHIKNANQDLQVRAPIPGVIIEVKVGVGDTVAFGKELCVLEAMKMKNAIRSGRSGVIDSIHISSGDQVIQNQVLMTFRKEGG